MVYCQKCGKQNEDGAQFCNKCGASLMGPPPRDHRKPREDECEEECKGSPKGNSIFWGIIIILVGLWIVFEFGVKNLPGRPDWVDNVEFWWIIPVIIGIAILGSGLRMIIRQGQGQRK